VPLASKQPIKQPQAQHSPAFKLPSSQAVNMAAVAARSHGHGSDDSRLGAPHGYGSMDSYSVSAGYQGMGGASAYQTAAHMQAAALNSFMPLYQQPAASQLPTAVGNVDFLLGGPGSSSAFREAPFAAPEAPMASQQYGGMSTSSGIGSSGLGGSMAGPQAPAVSAAAAAATAALQQHSMTAGPSSTGSRSGASGAGRGSVGNSAGALAIKRHLSADAPPFEAPSHAGGGSGAAGSGSSSAADTSSNAGGGPSQRRGGKAAASSSSSFSRQLFELAEQVQADEASREAERAEASKHQAELQEKLAAERASRAAAEARVAALQQELEASHQRNQVRSVFILCTLREAAPVTHMVHTTPEMLLRGVEQALRLQVAPARLHTICSMLF
jgi:hypothetical protein